MALDPSYLRYPKRRYGQDIDRYAWTPAPERGRAGAPALPGGAKLAVMIVMPCEVHPIDPAKTPFNHPHGMVTPFPDLRHFTSRDYGNRIGAFRLLDALKAAGLTAVAPVSAALIERAPALVEAILEDGCELAACGLHGDAIHHSGLSEDEERARFDAAAAAFARLGRRPTTWMSPARQESFLTPDLAREAGYERLLDWESDQVPLSMNTRAGPITALPVHTELDDFRLLVERKQDEASWARQILEAAAFLKAEHAERGAQALGFTLTPFVSGQPFRIRAVRGLLDALADDPEIAVLTAAQTEAAFAAGRAPAAETAE